MDIIFPELVYVSSQAEPISGRSVKADMRDGSISVETVNKFITTNLEQISNLEETKKGIIKGLEAQNAVAKEQRDQAKIKQLTGQLAATEAQIKQLEKSIGDLRKLTNNINEQ